MNEELELKDGVKRTDIQPCARCKKGLGHSNNIEFYRLKMDRHMVDINAVQHIYGMEQMLGGGNDAAAIAAVMSPDIYISKIIQEKELTICARCFYDPGFSVCELLEMEQ